MNPYDIGFKDGAWSAHNLAKKDAEATIAALQAENTKLKAERERADGAYDSLQAENAKLKKLNSQLVDKSNANTIANARLDEENAKLRRVADAAALYVGEPDMNTYLYNLEDALLEAGYKI